MKIKQKNGLKINDFKAHHPCELTLCYCHKLNNMFKGINFVNICMNDILACVGCLRAIALHLSGE